MTDRQIDTLLARAAQLEEANALLRSVQSPSGQDASLRAENVLLRHELDRLRAAPRASAAQRPAAGPPATLDEFRTMPASDREALARQMTRRQRDDILGRTAGQPDGECYL